jgi:hypothetical protein
MWSAEVRPVLTLHHLHHLKPFEERPSSSELAAIDREEVIAGCDRIRAWVRHGKLNSIVVGVGSPSSSFPLADKRWFSIRAMKFPSCLGSMQWFA